MRNRASFNFLTKGSECNRLYHANLPSCLHTHFKQLWGNLLFLCTRLQISLKKKKRITTSPCKTHHSSLALFIKFYILHLPDLTLLRLSLCHSFLGHRSGCTKSPQSRLPVWYVTEHSLVGRNCLCSI